MKLCFIADARSAIARNWISHFIDRGYDVNVISSYLCPVDALPGATVYQVPFAFAGFVPPETGSFRGSKWGLRSALRKAHSRSQGAIRTWLAPLDLVNKIGAVNRLIRRINPDLVHAMRIPFEGIMASMAVGGYSLLISCWGNDFEIGARPLPGRLMTARATRRAGAFHCDCEKDLRLAHQWGFPSDRPSAVLPGAGGVQREIFRRDGQDESIRYLVDIPPGSQVVVNPRGARIYVRNEVFFKAIPRVLCQVPQAFFICAALADDEQSHRMVQRLGIADRVRLLPSIERSRMATLFRAAQVSISPSVCDGTPNTLLESMACGCFPIAGNIDSVREWIKDDDNGLLFDPNRAEDVARAIVKALKNRELRERAIERNQRLIDEKADYHSIMHRAERFYDDIVQFSRRSANGKLSEMSHSGDNPATGESLREAIGSN